MGRTPVMTATPDCCSNAYEQQIVRCMPVQSLVGMCMRMQPAWYAHDATQVAVPVQKVGEPIACVLGCTECCAVRA
jgi:hypothetical protein